MKWDPIGRRHFLQGMGGFALALPCIPSLLVRSARASGAASTPRTNFVGIWAPHGYQADWDRYPVTLDGNGKRNANMSAVRAPSSGSAKYTVDMGGGHVVSADTLSNYLLPDGSFSTVVTAPTGTGNLVKDFADKISVIRGIDHPGLTADFHNIGAFMGNTMHAGGGFPNPGWGRNYMSYDQYLATVDSSGIYPSSYGGRRSMVMGPGGASEGTTSFDKNGNFIPPDYSDPLDWFNNVFRGIKANGGGGGGPSSEQSSRGLVIDSVYNDFKSTMSGRRIDADGKNFLNMIAEKFYSLETTLLGLKGNTNNTSGSTCTDYSAELANFRSIPTVNGSNKAGEICTDVTRANMEASYHLHNRLLALAFACGITRIGTNLIRHASFKDYEYDLNGDYWHNAWTHGGSTPGFRAVTSKTNPINQWMFQWGFMDLVKELHDHGVLDNSLVYFFHENGYDHTMDAVPVVLAGGAAGRLNTGLYVDYRNQAINSPTANRVYSAKEPGIVMPMFMNTLLGAVAPNMDWNAFQAYYAGEGYTSLPGTARKTYASSDYKGFAPLIKNY